jgi:hypothetical protein
MSIEEAIKRASAGVFEPAPETPVTDKGRAIFSSDLPFKQRWDQIMALIPELEASTEEDHQRFGSLIEGMHADAETVDDIQYMNREEGWQA